MSERRTEAHETHCWHAGRTLPGPRCEHTCCWCGTTKVWASRTVNMGAKPHGPHAKRGG